MKIMNRENFFYNVYAVVEEIPKGKVASYSLIAKAIGKPKNSRLVGTALKQSSLYGDYPCHRVVHSDGSLVEGWNEQYELLKSEGITFKTNKKVDMKLHLWQIYFISASYFLGNNRQLHSIIEEQ